LIVKHGLTFSLNEAESTLVLKPKMSPFQSWLFTCHLKQLASGSVVLDDQTKQLIERRLCEYYSLDSVEQAGLGTFNELIENKGKKHKESMVGLSESFIIYEDSL
jgi:hypothetical protein